MRSLSRWPQTLWWITPVLALGLLVSLQVGRGQRAARLSELAAPAVTVDPSSPTGYAGGWRKFVVPEPNHESYQWIVQTQQMLAGGDLRVRWVDYDNAPVGRPVHNASPYRWWLATVAWAHDRLGGVALPRAVERAALTADPILQGLLLVGVVLVVAWQFGGYAAAMVAVAVVALFPLAVAFVPGRPGPGGLSLMLAMGSGLALVTGMAGRTGRRSPVRWFAIAGGVGAAGLWVEGPVHLPWILGIAVGAALAGGLDRRRGEGGGGGGWPWRVWGLAGAASTLVAYAIEYLPSHGGDLELRAVHPLYGLAWLGLAECLAIWTGPERGSGPRARGWLPLALALIAVVTLPIVMLVSDQRGFFAAPALAERLTEVRGGVVAAHVFDALATDGSVGPMLAALLPLALLAVVVVRLRRAREPSPERQALAVIAGVSAVALALALVRLRWWAVVDAALLVALPVLLAGASAWPARRRAGWIAGAALVLLPGFWQVLPQGEQRAGATVNEAEVRALIERDLAQWLTNRRGAAGAIVLAPPQLTASLIHHGSLRGLGSPYWENEDGFAAAVRLCSPTSADEAQALFEGRGVTHVVMPSWDDFLQRYAALGSNQPADTLIGLLERWLPPRWLRPVPYQLPVIEGFEGRMVVVFEVVDVQEQTTALSRLAEYFVEMDRLDEAGAVATALSQVFADDIESLIAQAQVDAAYADAGAFAQHVRALVRLVGQGADRDLPFDRRASLAVVLAQARQLEPARAQVQQCLAEADEVALRGLTTTSLFRLQTLAQALGLRFADPAKHELARQLLPPELREQLPRP